jgi:hypothetical protein
MTEASVHAGSCLCGGVTFVATGPLRHVIACHCGQCRRTSGHFWAATSVPMHRFQLTHTSTLRWYRSSDAARRGFCCTCGASLFWRPDAEPRIAIAAGALDGPTGLRIDRHIYQADAGDYYAPEGPPPAAMAVQGTLDCGCLCGGVAFAVAGPAGEITACHCGQCRKLSGHFSASFDAHEATLHYNARTTLAAFLTPGGGRRGFCDTCGSSLWFRAADGAFSVEAGAVKGPTGGRLAGHIFVADKGDYYGIDDSLPQAGGW